MKIFETGRIQDHNYINGTVTTICEFFGKYCLDSLTNEIDFSGKTRMLDRVSDFIGETVDYFETEHYCFTHGWLPTVSEGKRHFIDENWRNALKERWEKARWIKWNEMYETCDRLKGKNLVVGHVPAFYAERFDPQRKPTDPSVFYGDGVTAIDAGTFTSGVVNVLKLEDELI